ncbi:hypothetical protein FB451DRAFT_1396775 [Mycena latifolia]|nr:hypothetical protein FB451DRAFT_1396775 [Mycena latifolia]
MAQRPYVEADLTGLKRADFVRLIEQQITKFPHPKGHLSKINMADMKKLLLDPAMGFTMAITTEHDGALSPRADYGPSSHVPEADVEGESVPQEAHTTKDLRPVQLLVSDHRAPFSPTKVSQHVDLPFIDVVGCTDTEWRTSSVELFDALQRSLGRLEGSGRMGIPDRREAQYTEYFVTFHTDEVTQTFATNMANIVIPPGNRLEIVVHRVRLPKREREHSPSPDPAAAFQSLIPSTSEPSSPAATRVRHTPEAGILWLKDKIQKRPGYETFHSNQGKVLQNLDRVEYWKFAAEVSHIFFKASWPAEIASFKISKTAIEKALGIGATTLSDAITMTRIIQTYTADGPNQSAEVVAEVTKSGELVVPGAGALKLFLQTWEKEHPINM